MQAQLLQGPSFCAVWVVLRRHDCRGHGRGGEGGWYLNSQLRDGWRLVCMLLQDVFAVGSMIRESDIAAVGDGMGYAAAAAAATTAA